MLNFLLYSLLNLLILFLEVFIILLFIIIPTRVNIIIITDKNANQKFITVLDDFIVSFNEV